MSTGRNGRWTIAIFALMGLGLGLLFFSLRSPTYEAEALVNVANPVGPLADQIAVANSREILNAAAAALGYEPDVEITAVEVSQLLTIVGSASDPQDAADSANAVANTYVQAQLGPPATIALPAQAPDSASGLGPIAFAAIGTAIGAILGLLVSMFRGPGTTRRRETEAAASPPRRRSQSSEPGVDDVAAAAKEFGWDSTKPVEAPAPRPAAGSMSAQPGAANEERAASSFQQLSGMADADTTTASSAPPASRSSVWSSEMPEASQPSPVTASAAAESPTHRVEADPPPAEFVDLRSLAATQPEPQPAAAQPIPALSTPPAATHQAVSPQPIPPQPIPPQPIPPQPIPPQPIPPQPEPPTEPPTEPPLETLIADEPPLPAEPEPAHAAETAAATMTTPEADALGAIERQAIQSKLEAALYERSLAHDQQIAHLRTEQEQQTAAFTSEIASLNKKLRVQTARLKNRAGTDQNRVGDLEAQLAAVEADLVEAKETLENERIAHAKRVTEQRGVADRALDNARRQYREELAKHVHTHRSSLADHRGDLDRELADDRARQASALEEEHRQYEIQLEAQRARSKEREEAAAERHERELARLRAETEHKLETQMDQHLETIAALRTTNEEAEQQVLQLEQDNRGLRAELSTQRKRTHETEIELQAQGQRLTDEMILLRSELDDERERNAALRSDVLRRSAEAHQAIDRAVEERTAQLAELEATVERQREYADKRVSEMSAAAEEQAREAAVREADLTAEISRLRREIDAAKHGS